jgi:hypothetical protein
VHFIQRALFAFLRLSMPAWAHGPGTDARASLQLYEDDAVWVVEFHFSTVAALRVYTEQHPDQPTPSAAVMKQWVVRYIKQTVRLEADQAPLAFGAGGIRMDGHIGSIRLSVNGMPEQPKQIMASIDSFTDHDHQQTTARVLHAGEAQSTTFTHTGGFRGVIWQRPSKGNDP